MFDWTKLKSSGGRLALLAAVMTALAVVPSATAVSGQDTIATVAGTGTAGFTGDGGIALLAQLNNPESVHVDAAGNLYIADLSNHRVRKVDTNGIITTVAGNGTPGFTGDGGLAIVAQLNSPFDVTTDAAGNLYIADLGNHRVRKVDTNGIITTVAGNGTGGFSGDGGPAILAQLNVPGGVSADGAGNLYIADIANNRIRKVDTNGIITTVAGNGTAGFSGDGGPAILAQLSGPERVEADTAGNFYIADDGNFRVRKVDTSGIITTVAGNGTAGFSGDGGPATAAQLDDPEGVALDSAGNLYVVDEDDHRIRKVDTAGIITTITGNGTAGFSADGSPAQLAQLNSPNNAAVGPDGSLYVADQNNQRVRKITNSLPTAAFAASPVFGPAPLSVSFDASGSSDAGGSIASYSWDFGDGNQGAGKTVAHSYQNAGSYTATLTVTDDSGGSAMTSTMISVTASADAPAPAAVPRCFGNPATIVGTPGPDLIVGTPGRDVIVARGGADVIRALRGNDLICAGGGADRVFAGGGADVVYGQGGNDLIRAGSGADNIRGQSGADNIFAGSGADIVRGGGAADVIRGQRGRDRMFGQGGPDRLIGGGGRDIANGGAGPDICLSSEIRRSC